jgi:hypothetical protein
VGTAPLLRNDRGRKGRTNLEEVRDLSMIEQVRKLDDRVVILEVSERERDEVDRAREERIKRLEDNATKLENTVMSENRDTRATVVEQNRQLFTLIESVMGFKATEHSQNHEYRVVKWDRTTNILLKVVGAGGVLYLLVQSFLNNM